MRSNQHQDQTRFTQSKFVFEIPFTAWNWGLSNGALFCCWCWHMRVGRTSSGNAISRCRVNPTSDLFLLLKYIFSVMATLPKIARNSPKLLVSRFIFDINRDMAVMNMERTSKHCYFPSQASSLTPFSALNHIPRTLLVLFSYPSPSMRCLIPCSLRSTSHNLCTSSSSPLPRQNTLPNTKCSALPLRTYSQQPSAG